MSNTTKVILLFSLLPCLIQCVAQQPLTRGPYLQLGTPDSITIRWRSRQATDSVVTYGTTPDQLNLQATLTEPTREHVVRLGGLQPNTRYYYTVGNSTKVLAGPGASYYFTTPPIVGSNQPTRIWILGDSGAPLFTVEATKQAYLRYTGTRATDLWIMLGDNAYPDGTDAQYQLAVFNMFPALLRHTVLWPTLGNHDGHSADSATQSGPYYDIFSLPTAAEAGGSASGTEAYYSFDYANVHFISLESYETDRSPSGAMMTWLDNDLAATQQPWIIAFWHHPPYSKGSHDSDTETNLREMRENALPILEAYGVDLVLSGHSHGYERSYLLKGHFGSSQTLSAEMIINRGDGRSDGQGAYHKASTVNEGTVYTVAGSSSIVSPAALNHPAMYTSQGNLGSLIVDVDGATLTGTFLGAGGKVRDRFSIDKNPDSAPPVLLGASALTSNQFALEFNEKLTTNSVALLTNYSLSDGLTLQQATLALDQRTIILTTSAPTAGASYTITVNGITDPSNNTISTQQATVRAI